MHVHIYTLLEVGSDMPSLSKLPYIALAIRITIHNNILMIIISGTLSEPLRNINHSEVSLLNVNDISSTAHYLAK